jgi:hypothetical protein
MTYTIIPAGMKQVTKLLFWCPNVLTDRPKALPGFPMAEYQSICLKKQAFTYWLQTQRT